MSAIELRAFPSDNEDHETNGRIHEANDILLYHNTVSIFLF